MVTLRTLAGDSRQTDGVREGPSSLSRAVAIVLVFLLPIKTISPLGSASLNLAVLGGLFFLLLGIIRLPGEKWAKRVLILLTIALVTSPVLTVLSLEDSSRRAESINRVGVTLLLVGGIVSILALCWCARLAGPTVMLASFSMGLLAQALIASPGTGLVWKGYLGWSITVLILIALSRIRSIPIVLLGILILAGVSFVLDSRAFGLFCVVALLMYGWCTAVRAKAVPSSRVVSFGVVSTIAVVGLVVGPSIAADGALGERVRERTVVQLANPGTFGLLTSARPESSAAWNLFKANPLGYGPGVTLSSAERASTKLAMSRVDANLNVDGGYIDRYVLNVRTRLHSVTADLWFNFGPFGFAAAVVMIAYLTRQAFRFMYFGTGNPVSHFLIFAALWDLVFSPIDSNLPLVVVAFLYTMMIGDKEDADVVTNSKQ